MEYKLVETPHYIFSNFFGIFNSHHTKNNLQAIITTNQPHNWFAEYGVNRI